MRSALKTVLVSPMFAWADTTVYRSRVSSVAPSRAGIGGILAAYLGLERKDKRIPEILSSFSMITKIYKLGNSDISIASDFSTVVMPKTLNANHRCRKDILLDTKSHRNTGVFPKEYIQNVAYEIILVDDGNIDKIMERKVEEQTYPEFSIFAGRKAYPFTVPVQWKRGNVSELVSSNDIPSELSGTLTEQRWENNILDCIETKKDIRLDNVNNFSDRLRTKRVESVLVMSN